MEQDHKRDPRYEAWIKEHYPTPDSARNMCTTASREMTEAFPELIRVRGWFGWVEHWWCKTASGEIVDPTRHQWPDIAGRSTYREFVDGIDPEPVGKCMNCGEYCWPFLNEEGEPVGENVPGAVRQEHVGGSHCSEGCYEALVREFG
jgi:hypothetical protein